MVKINFFCGKGGVGKTTSAVSLALAKSRSGEKTLLIDYDGGHSVKNILRIDQDVPNNEVYNVINHPNLSICIVENFAFKTISETQNDDIGFDEYFNQFPGEFGIVPFADMIHCFFGVPSDIGTLQKFITLIKILTHARDKFDSVIVDVEPTAGFERLLNTSNLIVRSLNNLQKTGVISLRFIGMKWPDVGKYLKTSYIKKVDIYTRQIISGVDLIKEGNYFLVCIPESGPVSQLVEVHNIINKFGCSVNGCVINNIRGEGYELNNIQLAEGYGFPTVKITHNEKLHTRLEEDYFSILSDNGEKIKGLI